MIKKELESAPNTIILLVTWSGVEKIELTLHILLLFLDHKSFYLPMWIFVMWKMYTKSRENLTWLKRMRFIKGFAQVPQNWRYYISWWNNTTIAKSSVWAYRSAKIIDEKMVSYNQGIYKNRVEKDRNFCEIPVLLSCERGNSVENGVGKFNI